MRRHAAAIVMLLAAACARGSGGPLPTGPGSFAPRLSRNADRIVLSWVERDKDGVPMLRFAHRGHEAWEQAKTVVRDTHLTADAVDVPAVVPLADGSLAAFWTVKRDGSDEARDLNVAVSRDDGATWSTPVAPYSVNSDSEHGMAAVVPGAAGGTFGICWLDGRAAATSEYGDGGTSLYWADWNGKGFGPETLLDPRVCDCCKTSAAMMRTGPVVAYRDRDDTDTRDISMVRRATAAWTEPAPVSTDGWTLTACPTNGPAIAGFADRAAVAWFTGAGSKPAVWAAVSTDGGATLGAPVRIDEGSPVGRVEAAALPDGSTAVVWLERKGEQAHVRARRIAPDGTLKPSIDIATTSPSRSSGYPAVVLEDANVLVAWTETGPAGRVRASAFTLP